MESVKWKVALRLLFTLQLLCVGSLQRAKFKGIITITGSSLTDKTSSMSLIFMQMRSSLYGLLNVYTYFFDSPGSGDCRLQRFLFNQKLFVQLTNEWCGFLATTLISNYHNCLDKFSEQSHNCGNLSLILLLHSAAPRPIHHLQGFLKSVQSASTTC